ncbi:MAG: hypothetical protein ACRD5M_03525 [Candidatus Acidiferrales bacterium]
MRIKPDCRRALPAVRSLRFKTPYNLFFRLTCLVVFAIPATCPSHAQSAANATWSVTIVLPTQVTAGRAATLAVFGADGKLASGVVVEIAKDQKVTTDTTGRAAFTAPSEGSFFIAKSSGRAAAALVDPVDPAADSQTIRVAPLISVKDSFSICGRGFRGEADANKVKINEERALILAASPECLIVLPGPKVAPGTATISVQTGEAHWTATTTVVSLEFESPQPALMPEKKSKLVVRADGSDQPLWIVAENQTPGVLEFLRGDVQKLRTSGGARNFTAIDVRAIRSGAYSFHARLVPASDPAIAERYLRAAEVPAPKELQHRLGGLAGRLALHPRDAQKVQREVERILSTTIAGDFRTLLESADAAL